MSAAYTDPAVGVNGARYNCVSDFLDAATIAKPRNSDNQIICDLWDNGHSHKREWLGVPKGSGLGTSAIVELVRNGWTEGLARINDTLGQIAPDIAAPLDLRRRLVWGDAGDEIDIHRVYSGQLQTAWRKSARSARRTLRHVSLAVDVLCGGKLDADVLFWRGAALVRLVDLLQEYGYIVSVMAGFCGQTFGNENVDCRITIKQPDQPVTLVDLAACTALPAFFRSIGHRWIPVHCNALSGNSGILVGALPADAADYLAGNRICSLQTASDWIKAVVAKINSTESTELDND